MRFAAALCLALVCLSGCGQKIVLVPPGAPVRLAEPVQARVATPDGNGGWQVGQSRVQIPAGWYAVPPPTTRP
jgi:hypothetical protein